MVSEAAWCAAQHWLHRAHATVRAPINSVRSACGIRPARQILQQLGQELQRRRVVVAHTVYECASCGERLVGERRCSNCNLFGPAIGLGGHCPECDTPLLLVDLLGEEVVATR